MLTFIYASLRRRMPGMLAALAVLLSSVLVLAAPADLDPTFGTNGIVITPIGAGYDRAFAMIIQPDGKLVVAGQVQTGLDFYNFALARYNTDGSLDTSFDGDGTAITPLDTSSSAYALAIQPDGKLVMAGFAWKGGMASNDFALVRYNTDGSLDTSFDGDGIVTTPIGDGSNDVAWAVAIQGDGKLVAAGFASYGSNIDRVALVRYNSDGSLDTSFDGDGKVATPFGTGYDRASALAIQDDGKLVVAVETQSGSSSDFALARYNTDGSLDTSFDGDGKVITSISPNYDTAWALVIQPDSKLVVAGDAIGGIALARYNTDGSLDSSFDGDGIVTSPLGSGQGSARALAIQPNGKLVVAGSTFDSDYDIALARYNTDGSLDTSFDDDGTLISPIGSRGDEAWAVAIQPDGKLVVAGYAFNGSNNDFVLARYQGDPLLTISSISNQAISEDGATTTLSFSVGDAQATPESLIVSASSSNTSLVPEANIVLAGSGANRTLTVTPVANRSGSATITLTVTNQAGASTQISFTLTVDPVNDPPALSNLSRGGTEDTPLSFAAGDFSAHFADADGDALTTVQIIALPSNGTLMLGGAPVTLNQEIASASLSQLSFVPDTNWNGSTSFGWSASDGTAYADPALVSLSIVAVNDAPSFIAGPNQTVASGAGLISVSAWASGFNPGPADEAGQTLLSYTVVSNSAPELFSVAPAIDPSGVLTFTPAPGVSGSATIQVTARDSGGTTGGGQDTSAVRTFTITITDASSYSVYLPLVLKDGQ